MNDDGEGLRDLLTPVPAEALRSHPVSRRVNSPEYDAADLIEPYDPADPAYF